MLADGPTGAVVRIDPMRTLLASCLLLGVGCGGSSASSDTQFANPDDPAYAASFAVATAP